MTPKFLSTILSGYIEVANVVGIDPYPILREVEIDPRWLFDGDVLLPASAVDLVLEESAVRSGRDDFGVLLADTRTFASLGPVALLLEHEHSAREILAACMEFRATFAEALSISIVDQEETTLIVLDVAPPYATPQLMSHVVAVALAVLRDTIEGRWRPLVAHFRHATPSCVKTYARFFRCPLEFNSSFDGLTCDRAAMDAVNPSAHVTLAVCARRLLNLMPQMSGAETISSRVRNTIYLLLRTGYPSLRRVAANHGVSARSLQRALANESQTFAGLLNGVRRDLATRYLAHSGQPVTAIAHLTGYSNVSSFDRWFTEQFNVAPSEWRRMRVAVSPVYASTSGIPRQAVLCGELEKGALAQLGREGDRSAKAEEISKFTHSSRGTKKKPE